MLGARCSRWLIKANGIAQRFVNLPSAKQVYENDFRVEFSTLVEQGSKICIGFSDPTKRGQALSWIYKTDLTNTFLLNRVFEIRLNRLSSDCGQNTRSSKNLQETANKEVTYIVFALAMYIVHEFALIAFLIGSQLQVQDKQVSPNSSQKTLEPKTPTMHSKNPTIFVTPEIFKKPVDI